MEGPNPRVAGRPRAYRVQRWGGTIPSGKCQKHAGERQIARATYLTLISRYNTSRGRSSYLQSGWWIGWDALDGLRQWPSGVNADLACQ